MRCFVAVYKNRVLIEVTYGANFTCFNDNYDCKCMTLVFVVSSSHLPVKSR